MIHEMKYLVTVPANYSQTYLQCFAEPHKRDWFLSEIGEENNEWYYDWIYHTFYFKREEDKVKFILRWL